VVAEINKAFQNFWVIAPCRSYLYVFSSLWFLIVYYLNTRSVPHLTSIVDMTAKIMMFTKYFGCSPT